MSDKSGDSEVGKVSLGLELVGGNELTKQIQAAAGTIGQQLNKSLQSTFGGFNLKGFAGNISDTLKATTETAMKGIVDGMEASVAAVEGRLTKTIGIAKQASLAAITEAKTAAEAAIDAVDARLSKVKPARLFPDLKSLLPTTAPVAAATPVPLSTAIPAPAAAPKVKAPKLDVDAAKAEVASLTAILDSVNAKIEIQERKLAELRQAYKETFNEAGKNKLQERIVNTEATLLRLTQTSDKTAKKIWLLEDSLKSAGQAAGVAKEPISDLDKKVTQADKPVKQITGNLNRAAKSAAGTGNAMSTAGSKAKKSGNSFMQAFSRIMKQVFVFALLYKAIRGFTDYLGSSLMTNKQYAASLNAVRTNLKVMFQPVYEAILPAINALMSGLAKVTAYAAAFTSALFGKSYAQSYQSAKGLETARKAMDKYGKSAKEAGKGLAGFDQLNLLGSKTEGTSDDRDDMKLPEMDMGGIQSQMDQLADEIQSTFDSTWLAIQSGWRWTVNTFGPSLQGAWQTVTPVLGQWRTQMASTIKDFMALGEPLKNWFLTDLIPFWQNGIATTGTILSGLLDSALNVFTGVREAVMPLYTWFVNEGLPLITEFGMGSQTVLLAFFGVAKQVFDDLITGVVSPSLKLLSTMTLDTLNIVKGFWNNWGKDIVAAVKTALDGIKGLWDNLWKVFLKPFVENMLKTLTWLWEKHLKGLVQEIADFVGALSKAALDIFNKFITPVVNWLVKVYGPTFANIFSYIGDIVGTAVATISDVLQGLIKSLRGVVEFIAGVFTGDWQRAWSGIVTFMGGIGDSIAGVFKGAVNVIIDAFNFMIRQLNTISVDIPEWAPMFGGEKFGINIPTIPKLAKGGLAYGPTLAMVGDNRGAAADPEVIAPLSKLEGMLGGGNAEMLAVLRQILEAIKALDRATVLMLNETELGRAVLSAVAKINRQAGYTVMDL